MKGILFGLWMTIWSLTFVLSALGLFASPLIWLLTGLDTSRAAIWFFIALGVASLAMSPVTIPFMIERSFGG